MEPPTSGNAGLGGRISSDAAALYADALPDQLDLVHLGLGPDGHTASLVPGDPVLAVMDRDVAITGVYQGRKRMTLTYPTLNRARQILWLVTGEDKVDALRRLQAGDQSIPAGLGLHDECPRRRRRRCGRIRDMSEQKERKYPYEPKAPAVLSVDVGGSNVKAVLNGIDERRRFPSGPKLTAQQMVDGVLEMTQDWDYVAVSVGIPAPVKDGTAVHDPANLGDGWAGFDFAKAFGKPTKVINDATMQALGSYQGGRMLFLGLGTGLGSTMILEGVIAPLELGHLAYKHGVWEDYVGEAALEQHGKKRWLKAVDETIAQFTHALEPEYIVIGGGNARELGDLPPHCRLGHNADAFLGGFRLWIDQD